MISSSAATEPNINLEGRRLLILMPVLRRMGPALGAIALAPELRRLGAKVTIGHLDPAVDLTDTELENLSESGVELVNLAAAGWVGLLKIFQLRKFVMQHGFDSVISYGLRPDLVNSLLPSRIARISYVRNMIFNDYRHRTGNQMLARGFATIHHTALRKLDAVLALSDGMKKYIVDANIPEEHVFKVMNILGRTWTDPTTEQGIHPTGKEIHVGFFGGLSRLKRVDWIVQAVADAIRSPDVNDDLILDIVGDGPEQRALELQVAQLGVESNVRFHGRVDDVRPLMRECSYVILASHSEGIPRVFMEAMTLGVTCVGSRIDGITDLIEDEVNGYLFGPSPSELSELLIKLISNGSTIDRSELSESSRKRFRAENSSRAIAAIVNNTIDSKLAQPATSGGES
ncbi:glycosyltransferase [Dehalococcoides mccartyi]|nr:glycosyltransferase [Dehalococcoides mccartyi]